MVASNILRNDRFAFLPIGDLHPFDGHARRHNAHKRKKLKKSVETFGQVMPILVDGDGVIIDGHALYEVLRELNYPEVAVAVVSGRSTQDVRALRLAINRLSDEADWDNAQLKREFEDLAAAGYSIEATGFDIAEVEFTLDIEVDALASPALDVPPSAHSPVTQRGDVWSCGSHKIACVDWRNTVDLARFLGGKKAMATVAYGAAGDPTIASGAEMATDGADDLDRVFEAVARATEDRGLIYLAASWRETKDVLAAAERHALCLVQLCASGKPSGETGRLYRESADFVFIMAKAGHAEKVRLSAHGRNRGNLWRPRIEALEDNDPSLALIDNRALLRDLMRDATKRGDIVFTTTLATGGMLLAAEERARICYGVDPRPSCVDTAIRLWQRESGYLAMRVRDGKSYAECEAVAAKKDLARNG